MAGASVGSGVLGGGCVCWRGLRALCWLSLGAWPWGFLLSLSLSLYGCPVAGWSRRWLFDLLSSFVPWFGLWLPLCLPSLSPSFVFGASLCCGVVAVGGRLLPVGFVTVRGVGGLVVARWVGGYRCLGGGWWVGRSVSGALRFGGSVIFFAGGGVACILRVATLRVAHRSTVRRRTHPDGGIVGPKSHCRPSTGHRPLRAVGRRRPVFVCGWVPWAC